MVIHLCVYLEMMNESRVEGEGLGAPLKGALVWSLVGMQAFDMILQCINSGEASITELTLDARSVGVVDLKVTLKTVRTIKCLQADSAIVSVCVCV